MPTTISISLASISGEAGPFTLFLRKTSDRSLVNTGGDALTEVEVATVKTGVWTATVAETIPAEDCLARIYEGTSEAAAAILIDSVLYEGQTEIGREAAASGGLTPEESETLDSIAIALSGSAPVEPTGVTVFEHLELIQSQTSQITGSRISSVGPVKPGGDIELIVGQDYKVAAGTNGTHLPIAIADVGGVVYGEFTSGTFAASKSFGMRRDNGDALIAGTVHSLVYSADVTTFKIEIDADQLPDTLDLTDDYTYQIQRVTSTGDKVVGVQGAGAVTLRTV